MAWRHSLTVCKKSDWNRQGCEGDKWRKKQNRKQKNHRSERSSRYSADHEHTKKRWKEEYETLKEPKSHMFGGSPNDLLFEFKYWKVRIYKGFFPWQTCKLLLVRGTISFYKPETANFASWRKCYVEYINVIKWAMLNVKYFVFNCVSLAVRAF